MTMTVRERGRGDMGAGGLGVFELNSNGGAPVSRSTGGKSGCGSDSASGSRCRRLTGDPALRLPSTGCGRWPSDDTAVTCGYDRDSEPGETGRGNPRTALGLAIGGDSRAPTCSLIIDALAHS